MLFICKLMFLTSMKLSVGVWKTPSSNEMLNKFSKKTVARQQAYASDEDR